MTHADQNTEHHFQAADLRLVEAVRGAGRNSRESRDLAGALADLVIGTLFNLDKKGRLFAEVHRQCAIRLGPPPADYRRHLGEIVFHSAGEAVPAFLEQWVFGGRWRPGGAALGSCAVRAGLYGFAHEYSQFFARQRVREPELVGPETLEILLESRPHTTAGSVTAPSPEQVVVDRMEIETLLDGVDPRTAAMVALLAEGHSRKNIGERLGMHPEAVSSALRRFRNQFR